MNASYMFLFCVLKSLQKFEAYDSKGAVVAGDKDKEVRDMIVHKTLLVATCFTFFTASGLHFIRAFGNLKGRMLLLVLLSKTLSAKLLITNHCKNAYPPCQFHFD